MATKEYVFFGLRRQYEEPEFVIGGQFETEEAHSLWHFLVDLSKIMAIFHEDFRGEQQWITTNTLSKNLEKCMKDVT